MPDAPSIGRLCDHVALLVPALEPAAAAMESLGFRVTSRGSHATFGTSNCLIQFDREYLELLTVDVPAPSNALHRQALAQGGGMRVLALPSRDIEAETMAARARGVAMPASQSFGRPLPDGGEARFRVAFLPPGAAPAMTFLCQHLTPDLVWRADVAQPNGAAGIVAMQFVVEDAQGAAREVAAVLGDVVTEASEDTLSAAGQSLGFVEHGPPTLTIGVATQPQPDALAAAGFQVFGHPGGISASHPALGDVELRLVKQADRAE